MIAVAATAGSLALTSCEDQLDIVQKGVTDINDFYKTDADADQALAAAYESFMVNVMGRAHDNGGPGIYTPYKIVTNMCGDDVLYASGNYGDHEFAGMLNEFRYDSNAEAVRFLYNGLYASVYHCNLVISNYANPETTIQQRAVSEARVLRAYDYFMLATLWGNPPMILAPIGVDALPNNTDMTQQELYRWVASECEAALGDLKERESKTDKNGSVIVTKGFANALAGKAYLFAKDYDKAKTALKKVIDSEKYDLVPGDRFMDNFHIEGDCNEEKVFELEIGEANGVGPWGGMIQRSSWMESNAWNWRAGNFKANPARKYCGIDGWGGLGVPQWFADAFLANDGHSARFDASLIHIDDAVYTMDYTPISESGETEAAATESLIKTLTKLNISQAEAESYKPYFKSELSSDGKQYNVSLDYNDIPVDLLKTSHLIGISDLAQGLYGNSFYLQLKQLMKASDTQGALYGDNIRLNNYIVMRYAEVLLNYAEACLQTGDAAEAKIYINKIQERAGSKTISATVDMDVLKKEKMFELWTEGSRFFDIIRWNDATGIAHIEKSGTDVPHLYDKLFRAPVKVDVYDENGKVKQKADVNITWENGTEENSRFYTVSTHAAMDAGFEVGFKKGKHELLPFPQREIDMNSNLRQNPGW